MPILVHLYVTNIATTRWIDEWFTQKGFVFVVPPVTGIKLFGFEYESFRAP